MTDSAPRSGLLLERRGAPAAPYLLLISVVGSLAMVAIGFANSDILSNAQWTRWTSTMIQQVGAVGLGVVFVVALAIAAERRWRLRLEAGMAAAGAMALAFAFGVAPVVLIAIFLISATALGVCVCDRSHGAKPLPLPLVTTLGVAIYAILFTLIGPFRINAPWAHSCLLIAPLVIAAASPRARRILSARAAAFAQAMRPPEARTPTEVAGLAAFLFVAILQALLAALPERYWDAMATHLYIPSYVSAHRAWDFDVISYVWAYWPLAVDWIYTHFFLLGGEPATRLYNFTALMLVCATLFAILRREASREVSIWMPVLLASMPIVFIETSSLFVENTLTLWITAAVGIIVVADLRPTAREAIAAFVLLAVATMSKLHGAIAAAVIGPVLLVLVLRQRPPARTIVLVLAAALVSAAVGCFPYINSWIATGSPFFPLYNDIFKSSLYPTTRFVNPHFIGNFKWSMLYDATFASSRFCEVSTGALGLTMLFAAPLALASILTRPSAKMILCFAVATIIFLPIAFEIQYLRYFYPLFPLLLIPAGVGVTLLPGGRRTHALTLAMFVAIAAFNVYKLPSGGWILSNFDLHADFGLASRRALELAQAPERIANRMINDDAGDNTRVLYTANPYGALLQGRALYVDWYNHTLVDAMAQVATPEQAKALLVKWGVTHVIYDPNANRPGEQVLGAYLAAQFHPMARLGALSVYDVRQIP